MKFFVSAIEQDRTSVIAREIEAECFDDALEDLREMAAREFEGRPHLLTSVTQVPEMFCFPGSAVIATGVVHGEAMQRRNSGMKLNGGNGK